MRGAIAGERIGSGRDEAVLNAISLGGDAEATAGVAGRTAAAFQGDGPAAIRTWALTRRRGAVLEFGRRFDTGRASREA